MSLTDEAKKARNEYYRNWRNNNRDKVKAAQARYWQKVAREQGINGDNVDQKEEV